jgi:hypothetical protein
MVKIITKRRAKRLKRKNQRRNRSKNKRKLVGGALVELGDHVGNMPTPSNPKRWCKKCQMSFTSAMCPKKHAIHHYTTYVPDWERHLRDEGWYDGREEQVTDPQTQQRLRLSKKVKTGVLNEEAKELALGVGWQTVQAKQRLAAAKLLSHQRVDRLPLNYDTLELIVGWDGEFLKGSLRTRQRDQANADRARKTLIAIRDALIDDKLRLQSDYYERFEIERLQEELRYLARLIHGEVGAQDRLWGADQGTQLGGLFKARAQLAGVFVPGAIDYAKLEKDEDLVGLNEADRIIELIAMAEREKESEEYVAPAQRRLYYTSGNKTQVSARVSWRESSAAVAAAAARSKQFDDFISQAEMRRPALMASLHEQARRSRAREAVAAEQMRRRRAERVARERARADEQEPPPPPPQDAAHGWVVPTPPATAAAEAVPVAGYTPNPRDGNEDWADLAPDAVLWANSVLQALAFEKFRKVIADRKGPVAGR